MRAAVAGGPTIDMSAADLLEIGIPTVVDRFFYHISRPIFVFLLGKIVFLIVKLVTRG